MERNKKRKKKRFLFTSLSLLFLVSLATIFIFYFVVMNDIKEATEKMYEPIARGSTVEKPLGNIDNPNKPLSFLIIGVDQMSGQKGRADTLIYMAVNPSTEKMQMVSIPRDTKTLIHGKGFEDKINHAFSFGGIEMTIFTVEHFLQIPVDYYIRVNMQSFQDIVNAVGGITVYNDFDFWWEGEFFPEGELQLNGKRALIFARMRKVDPRGDFGRQDRQQQVIQSIINKGASLSTLKNYKKVLETLGENVKTNLTYDDMKKIPQNYAGARKNVEKLQIVGNGAKINGIYYFIPDKNSINEIRKKLKENLNE